MVQATDTFVRNIHKPTSFHAHHFYHHAIALLDELHVRHMKHNKERFPAFTLFLQTKIQQTRNMTHTIMTLFITTMRHYNYDTMDKSNKSNVKAEMQEKHWFLKVDCHFNFAETASSSKSVLGENAMKAVRKKKCLRKARSTNLTEEIEVIELDDLESEMVPPNKAAKNDQYSTLYRKRKTKEETTKIEPKDKMTKHNATDKPAGTTEALEIAVIEKAQTSITNSKPLVHSACNDKRGHKLQFGSTEPSMQIDMISRSDVDSCYRLPCCHDSMNDDKYDQLAQFLCAFLFPQNYRASVFCQNIPPCFCAIWYGCTEQYLLWMSIISLTGNKNVWNKALEL